MDNRHADRIKIVQELYSHLVNTKSSYTAKTAEILTHLAVLDKKIEHSAKKYRVDKIPKVDLSILRLALYELLIEKKEPPKVIINEAINLAKELAGEKSPGFINAVLGKIYEETKL